MAQMQASGIEPNTETYNCALNGLAKRREWYRARRLFRKMVAGGRCTPDVVTYNGLVEAAGMGSLSPRQDMIQVTIEGNTRASVFIQWTWNRCFDGCTTLLYVPCSMSRAVCPDVSRSQLPELCM